jgi:hypothetical protein
MLFVAAVAFVGAVDALWRSSLAWPVCQEIRRRDILDTTMSPRLRVAEWNNHRLVIQLVAGCAVITAGVVWGYLH